MGGKKAPISFPREEKHREPATHLDTADFFLKQTLAKLS